MAQPGHRVHWNPFIFCYSFIACRDKASQNHFERLTFSFSLSLKHMVHRTWWISKQPHIPPPFSWLLILCSTFYCWWSLKYDEESIQSIFTRINKMVKTLKQMFLPRKYCRRWQVTKPNCQNWLACKTHFVW